MFFYWDMSKCTVKVIYHPLIACILDVIFFHTVYNTPVVLFYNAAVSKSYLWTTTLDEANLWPVPLSL